jgi:16S rRNA processing protein RimM
VPETARLEVGRIVKPHGLTGEVVVAPITDRAERFAPGAHLYLGDEPVVVTGSRPHQRRWLLRIDGIDDRDAAEGLRGRVLSADPPAEADEGAYWVHELIGSAVVTVGGAPCGEVVSVQDNPAHDLLVLDSGVLVPMVFVVEHRDGTVVIDPPAGLLEL